MAGLICGACAIVAVYPVLSWEVYPLLLPSTGAKRVRELHMQVMDGTLLGAELEAAVEEASKELECIEDDKVSIEANTKVQEMQDKKASLDFMVTLSEMDPEMRKATIKSFPAEKQKEIVADLKPLMQAALNKAAERKADGLDPEAEKPDKKEKKKSKKERKKEREAELEAEAQEEEAPVPPNLGRCPCCVKYCYWCCLSWPCCSHGYTHWGIRAVFYVVFALPLFGYMQTLIPGATLCVTALVYLFAWWRGESMPKLLNPRGKMANQGDDDDEEEEDDEFGLNALEADLEAANATDGEATAASSRRRKN